MRAIELKRHVAAGALLLLCSGWLHATPVTVTGVVTGYNGPVGKPIYPGPVAEPAQTDSLFSVDGGAPFVITPTARYPGYEASPEFDGTGTGSAPFSGARVEFWNRFNNDPGSEERHNVVALLPGAGDINATGEEFRIATLVFTNGDWFSNSPYNPGNGQLYPLSLFGVHFATQSGDAQFDGHTWTDQLVYFSTRFATGNTPEQNADYLYFADHTELGKFSVYEGGSASVDVMGIIGSLIPTRFANVQNLDPNGPGGFIVPAAVPEPLSLALLGLALAALGFSRRRSC